MSSHRPKISVPAFHVPSCHLKGHISISHYAKFNPNKSKQKKGGLLYPLQDSLGWSRSLPEIIINLFLHDHAERRQIS